ncbi:MAG: glycosyltransferase family 4 protein, partial [Thiotrichaceae bacterium]|nr:glycosyltransferase family 4 protein [Thiotrichaceae bacterium]
MKLIPAIMQALFHDDFYLIGDKKAILSYSWANEKNVKVINNQTPIYSVSEQLKWCAINTIQADLFWSPHYNIPLFFSGKQLVTIHDVFHLAMPQFVGGMHKRWYAKAMFFMVKEKADRIICGSQFTADELIRLTGVSPKKISVIHLGVGHNWFNIKKEISPHPKPYLLYVGNVKPHKNLTRLLSAFESLIDIVPHDLVIAGKKEGFITGDKDVVGKASALSNRIKFTGFINEHLLEQYFSHAEALVLPSLYEGFGLPPLEAMACGCPVIVSNVASLPEVCADAAIYFDPYKVEDISEKIKLVIDNEQLRIELCAKGIERAKQFSWDES